MEELNHCCDLVAEYDAIAPTRRAARNACTPGPGPPGTGAEPAGGSTSGGSPADPAHGMAASGAELVSGTALIGTEVGPFPLAA